VCSSGESKHLSLAVFVPHSVAALGTVGLFRVNPNLVVVREMLIQHKIGTEPCVLSLWIEKQQGWCAPSPQAVQWM
jgi:hypothetical protein